MDRGSCVERQPTLTALQPVGSSVSAKAGELPRASCQPTLTALQAEATPLYWALPVP